MKHQLGLPEDYGIADSDGEQGRYACSSSLPSSAAVVSLRQLGYTLATTAGNC